VNGQASGQANAWDSFGESDGGPRDRSLAQRHQRAGTRAVVLVVVAVAFGIAPNWLLGRSFIATRDYVSWRGGDGYWRPLTHSLWHLVTHDPVWAGAVAMLAVTPLWFWWWRRSAMAFGAGIGVTMAVAAAGAVAYCATPAHTFGMPDAPMTSGTYWTLYAAAACFAAAFLVAPPPRDRESLNALQVRSLVRRHRKGA
jgi:hypothetical protein